MIMDVTIRHYRLTYDRNVRHSFYIGGYVIEDTRTGEKRCTTTEPSIHSSYDRLLTEASMLFATGNKIRE